LKVAESRVVAGLLLRGIDKDGWRKAIFEENVLQARNPATAKRLSRLIRGRLETMGPGLWRLLRDGTATVAAHAALAAAVKHSRLLGDFLDLAVREQYRLYGVSLSNGLWDEYLEDCRGRDPEMPAWNESTKKRLRSSVFQILAQAGYIENTRSRKLQAVDISPEVVRYMEGHNEHYVLRCIKVAS
jgi:hypothetical protein